MSCAKPENIGSNYTLTEKATFINQREERAPGQQAEFPSSKRRALAELAANSTAAQLALYPQV
jgi:hypothetical protein